MIHALHHTTKLTEIYRPYCVMTNNFIISRISMHYKIYLFE
jgi:hypothetical protein